MINGRIFLLIFFFWAFLTIITPTLIHLSASAKPNFDSKDEETDRLKARRMMGYLEKQRRSSTLQVAPAPAPAPEPPPPLAELGDWENAYNLHKTSRLKAA